MAADSKQELTQAETAKPFQEIEPRGDIRPERFRDKTYKPNEKLEALLGALTSLADQSISTETLQSLLRGIPEQLLVGINTIHSLHKESTEDAATTTTTTTNQNIFTSLADRVQISVSQGYYQGEFSPPAAWGNLRTQSNAQIIQLAFSQPQSEAQQTAHWLISLIAYDNFKNINIDDHVAMRMLNEAISIYRISQELLSASTTKTPAAYFSELLEVLNPTELYLRMLQQVFASLVTNDIPTATEHYILFSNTIYRPGFGMAGKGDDELAVISSTLGEAVIQKNQRLTPSATIFRQMEFYRTYLAGHGHTGFYFSSMFKMCVDLLSRAAVREKPGAQMITASQYKAEFVATSCELQQQAPFTAHEKTTFIERLLPTDITIMADDSVNAQTTTFNLDAVSFRLKNTVLVALHEYTSSTSKNRIQSYRFIQQFINAINDPLPRTTTLEALMAIGSYCQAFANHLNRDSSKLGKASDTRHGQKFTRMLLAQMAMLLELRKTEDFNDESVHSSVKTKMATKEEQAALATEISTQVNALLSAAFGDIYLDEFRPDRQRAEEFLRAMLAKEYEKSLPHKRQLHERKIVAGFNIITAVLILHRTQEHHTLIETTIPAAIALSDGHGKSARSNVLGFEAALTRTMIVCHYDITAEQVGSEEIAELLQETITTLYELFTTKMSSNARQKNTENCRGQLLLAIKLIGKLTTLRFDELTINKHAMDIIGLMNTGSASVNWPWLCYAVATPLAKLLSDQVAAYASKGVPTPRELEQAQTNFNQHTLTFLEMRPTVTLDDVQLVTTARPSRPSSMTSSANKKPMASTTKSSQPWLVINTKQLAANHGFLSAVAESGFTIVLLQDPQEKEQRILGELQPVPSYLQPTSKLQNALHMLNPDARVIVIEAKKNHYQLDVTSSLTTAQQQLTQTDEPLQNQPVILLANAATESSPSNKDDNATTTASTPVNIITTIGISAETTAKALKKALREAGQPPIRRGMASIAASQGLLRKISPTTETTGTSMATNRPALTTYQE